MTEWFRNLLANILGVQAAITSLKKHIDARFDAVEKELVRIEQVAGLPAAELEAVQQSVAALSVDVAAGSAITAEVLAILSTPPAPEAELVFSIQIEGNTLQGVRAMTLKPGKRYRASVSTQPAGARIDGAVSWGSSDPNVVAVEPEGDGRTAVVSTPSEGVAELTISADADLGEGVRAISATVGVIVGLEAESLGLSFEEIGDIEQA